jgi:hypothetical protein
MAQLDPPPLTTRRDYGGGILTRLYMGHRERINYGLLYIEVTVHHRRCKLKPTFVTSL